MRLAFAVVLSVASLTGCKSMGGFDHIASGLGRGLEHVAEGAAHVAVEGAKLAPIVEHAVARTAPIAVDAVAKTAEITMRIGVPLAEALVEDTTVTINTLEPAADVTVDPCIDCPLEDACGSCTGWGDQACAESPAYELARCSSTAARPE